MRPSLPFPLATLLSALLRVLRYAWASPNTLLGLLLAAIGLIGGGRLRWIDGAFEAHGPWLQWSLNKFSLLPGGIAAITFGHLIIAQTEAHHDRTRYHERVHVEQYGRWGPFFLPAYGVASIWAKCKGRPAYLGNCFEREAYARDAARE